MYTKMKITIGIDIGGTNTQWGLVNQKGEVLQAGNVPTKNYPKASNLVKDLVQKITPFLSAYQVMGIGVGAPNGNFFNGTIEFAPNLDWNGIIPLAKLFSQQFGCPAWVTNDANAAAIGEQQFGAAKGVQDFVVVTLGTGLGSGFVVNGKLMYGHDGFAGELGHTILELEGRNCGCGRQGCLETYVSATGLLRTARIFLAKNNQATSLVDNEKLSAKQIGEAALEGDKLALDIFDFTAQKLGFALANMVAITSPQMIVLFGGLAQSGNLLLVPTQKYMEQYLLPIFKNKIKLTLSTIHKNDAAILGASALAWHQITSKNYD